MIKIDNSWRNKIYIKRVEIMYSVGLLDMSHNSKYLFMRIYLYHLTGINYRALLSLVWKRQMEYNIEHFLIFIKVIVKYHVIKSNMQLS